LERDIKKIEQILTNSRPRIHDMANRNEQLVTNLAIEQRDFKLLELMFQYGMPGKYHPGYFDQTYLYKRITGDDYEMFLFLLPYCPITDIEITMLVSYGKTEMFRLIHERGIPLPVRAHFYSIAGGPPTPKATLFGWAVINEAYKIAQMIYDSSDAVEINATLTRSFPDTEVLQLLTPLDAVIESKYKPMEHWLIDRGARSFTEIAAGYGLTEIRPPLLQKEAVPTTDYLRIRSKPTLQGEHLGFVHKKDIVYVLSVSSEIQTIDGLEDRWYLIRSPENITGWVFGGYLKISHFRG
jgi:hypothetical protein